MTLYIHRGVMLFTVWDKSRKHREKMRYSNVQKNITLALTCRKILHYMREKCKTMREKNMFKLHMREKIVKKNITGLMQQ